MPKRQHTEAFVTCDGVRVSYDVWPDGQGVNLKFECFREDTLFGLQARDIGEMCSLMEGAREACLQQLLKARQS